MKDSWNSACAEWQSWESLARACRFNRQDFVFGFEIRIGPSSPGSGEINSWRLNRVW